MGYDFTQNAMRSCSKFSKSAELTSIGPKERDSCMMSEFERNLASNNRSAESSSAWALFTLAPSPKAGKWPVDSMTGEKTDRAARRFGPAMVLTSGEEK
jgi:hypothetical protein